MTERVVVAVPYDPEWPLRFESERLSEAAYRQRQR
jgi:hypothetical protein